MPPFADFYLITYLNGTRAIIKNAKWHELMTSDIAGITHWTENLR